MPETPTPPGSRPAAPAPPDTHAAPVAAGDGRGEPATAEGQAQPGNVGTFYSLRFRSFRYLWFGSFFSSACQWVQQATLGWVVYDRTGSSTLLGAINGTRSVPMLFFAPLGGVAADRVNRKGLMITSQLFIMVLCFALAVDFLLEQDRIWHLFVFTALTGVAWSFNMPVRQSVVYNLVPRYSFPNAVGLNSISFNSTRVLGPAAAGFLISWLGPQGNFFVESAAYLGVAISVLFVTIPPLGKAAREQSVLKNLKEGAGYVAREPTVRTLILMGLFPVFFAAPYMSLMPIFAKDVFHSGAGSYGLMLSAAGVGGLIGGLFTASLGGFQRRGLLQLAMMLTFGLGLVAFSFANSLVVGLVILVFTGFGQMVFMTTNQTLLQMHTPDELRGRVTSIYMFDQGLMPLGTLVAGVVADFISVSTLVAIMGVACVILAAMIFFWLPRVRNMRMSGPVPVRGRGFSGG